MLDPVTIARTRARAAQIEIRSIDTADIGAILAEGYADFKKMPSHFMFLSVMYPIIGLLLARLAVGYEILPLLFPLAAGFALIGPLAAIGLIELSRRREQGHDPFVWHALGAYEARSVRPIVIVGVVLAAIFVVWLATADAIYGLTLGRAVPDSLGDFVGQVLTTPGGWALIILGNGFGMLFAILALAVGVISIPLLLDREVGALSAMEASVMAIVANPRPMAFWGLVVALGLVIGSLPCFLGLVVVMPILGHSSWHLYRKVVA
jgi:uncharacterized membrane protein